MATKIAGIEAKHKVADEKLSQLMKNIQTNLKI